MTRQSTPRLIIHGGAGALEGNVPDPASPDAPAQQRLREIHAALAAIAREAYQTLLDNSAMSAVLKAVSLLEDNPLFNAGTGAKLQADGQARLSAGLMDGNSGRFSGVINLEQVRNPIQVAARLAGGAHTVLAGELATIFARQEGFPLHDPVTAERLAEYQKRIKGKSSTVGAVALDREGRIVAGTSTGGIGGETPGRVSDCPTVAGTYASVNAGVSCTGVGEEIINTAAAARIVTRVDDGMPLERAVDSTMEAASGQGYRFGLIALDRQGQPRVGRTLGVGVLYAIHHGDRVETFYGSD